MKNTLDILEEILEEKRQTFGSAKIPTLGALIRLVAEAQRRKAAPEKDKVSSLQEHVRDLQRRLREEQRSNNWIWDNCTIIHTEKGHETLHHSKKANLYARLRITMRESFTTPNNLTRHCYTVKLIAGKDVHRR